MRRDQDAGPAYPDDQRGALPGYHRRRVETTSNTPFRRRLRPSRTTSRGLFRGSSARPAHSRATMQRLGYGHDKRLAISLSARNRPVDRDPAVVLLSQLKEVYIEFLGQASAAGTAITVSTNGARCQPSLASANAAAPKAIATITRRQSSAVKMNIADTQRAGTGAQEIGAIDSTNPCRGCGKSETNSAPGCKERHRQQQVHRRQV